MPTTARACTTPEARPCGHQICAPLTPKLWRHWLHAPHTSSCVLGGGGVVQPAHAAAATACHSKGWSCTCRAWPAKTPGSRSAVQDKHAIVAVLRSAHQCSEGLATDQCTLQVCQVYVVHTVQLVAPAVSCLMVYTACVAVCTTVCNNGPSPARASTPHVKRCCSGGGQAGIPLLITSWWQLVRSLPASCCHDLLHLSNNCCIPRVGTHAVLLLLAW